MKINELFRAKNCLDYKFESAIEAARLQIFFDFVFKKNVFFLRKTHQCLAE